MSAIVPPDDPLRLVLHNEVHARPSDLVRLPAVVVSVALLNDQITRQQECAHLRLLPQYDRLDEELLKGNFLRLVLEGCLVQWERHTEFSRYTIVQALPPEIALGSVEPDLISILALPAGWLAGLPGRTFAAIELAMVHDPLMDAATTMRQAHRWFGEGPVVGSQLGLGHTWALTQFKVGANGFERMLAITPTITTDTRAGRVSQRLLEIETYRLMALRGLPVAKELGAMLAESELALATITAHMENKLTNDQDLLDKLVSMAARVERATAQHSYRFSATRAYNTLVTDRIGELREKAISGTQTLGEFMRRRLTPAMATVMATEQRLASLSERVARASALLRTRVDIATEAQNQQLLEQLNRGQALQLRLQTTVEGLSIAAISYYVVSLALYAGKALKASGLPINPEVAAGVSIPFVVWAVWRTTRRIHAALHKHP
jgi:uncharacterized membrane-anchored protein